MIPGQHGNLGNNFFLKNKFVLYEVNRQITSATYHLRAIYPKKLMYMTTKDHLFCNLSIVVNIKNILCWLFLQYKIHIIYQ